MKGFECPLREGRGGNIRQHVDFERGCVMTTCLLCSGSEQGRTQPATGAEFVCSMCVQTLLSVPPEKIGRAHQEAVARGLELKASALEMFTAENQGEEEYVPKTGKPKRGLERRRIVRETRPTHRQGRAEHTVRVLDQGRVAFRGEVGPEVLL